MAEEVPSPSSLVSVVGLITLDIIMPHNTPAV